MVLVRAREKALVTALELAMAWEMVQEKAMALEQDLLQSPQRQNSPSQLNPPSLPWSVWVVIDGR
jgi:hypothetical protein